MHLLQSGVDITVIALWLGHESPTTTHMYPEADLAMKEHALSQLSLLKRRQHVSPAGSALGFPAEPLIMRSPGGEIRVCGLPIYAKLHIIIQKSNVG